MILVPFDVGKKRDKYLEQSPGIIRGWVLTGWLMSCLLCLTSGLIKEKHPRPGFDRSHWSAPTAERDGRNSSLTTLPAPTKHEPEPTNNCRCSQSSSKLQTGMAVDSHCRVNRKKEEEEKKKEQLLAVETLSGMWFKYIFFCQSWLLLRRAIRVVVETPSSIFGPSKHTPPTSVPSKTDRTALSCTACKNAVL